MINLLYAAAPSGDPILDWLSRAGALGVLAFVVLAFLRGWIVPGTTCEGYKKERDKAMDQVFELADITRRSLSVAAEKTREKHNL